MKYFRNLNSFSGDPLEFLINPLNIQNHILLIFAKMILLFYTLFLEIYGYYFWIYVIKINNDHEMTIKISLYSAQHLVSIRKKYILNNLILIVTRLIFIALRNIVNYF